MNRKNSRQLITTKAVNLHIFSVMDRTQSEICGKVAFALRRVANVLYLNLYNLQQQQHGKTF